MEELFVFIDEFFKKVFFGKFRTFFVSKPTVLLSFVRFLVFCKKKAKKKFRF